MAYSSQTRNASMGIVERIASLRLVLAEAIAQRKIYRTTKAELENLTDRDLNDLGLNRSVIGVVAREAAYGKNF